VLRRKLSVCIKYPIHDILGLHITIRLIFRKREIDQANKIQIVLNILGQFIAHTLATVTLNKHISFMSIGFLVVVLVLIDDEN